MKGKLYQVIREVVNGEKYFVGMPKGYKSREQAKLVIDEQKEYEKSIPKSQYSGVKFFIRTYELISEEEV